VSARPCARPPARAVATPVVGRHRYGRFGCRPSDGPGGRQTPAIPDQGPLETAAVTETARLVPGKDDAALDAALDLAGRTVGSTGMVKEDARVVYDANDCGTSCVFVLTEAEGPTRRRSFATKVCASRC
jgi:hypothetical protein